MADTLVNPKPKDRGILYGADMVRAILEGRKTQTRRVFAHQPEERGGPGRYQMLRERGRGMVWDTNQRHIVVCDGSVRPAKVLEEREYLVGLPEWLAEHCPWGRVGDRLYVRETWGTIADVDPARHPGMVRFRADGPNDAVPRWRPSIHLPRSLSRVVLNITAVRAERVQDITEADAIAEGIHRPGLRYWTWGDGDTHDSPRDAFAALWDRTNSKYLSWENNPWTSVVTFEPEVSRA